MEKLILSLSLLGIAILFLFGLVAPDSSVVWWASSSIEFAILRLAMIISLAVLLVTHPPRNRYLRVFMGIMSVSLAGWALGATYQNHMQLLDTLSLLEFSVSAGLVVLERNYNEEAQDFSQLVARARQARQSDKLV